MPPRGRHGVERPISNGRAPGWRIGQSLVGDKQAMSDQWYGNTWQVRKLVLPLIDRGYLTYNDLGMDGRQMTGLDPDQRALAIGKALKSADFTHGHENGLQHVADNLRQGPLGTHTRQNIGQSLSPYAPDTAQITTHVSLPDFAKATGANADPQAASNYIQSRLMLAVQRFQEDNGIHGAGKQADGSFKTGHGVVGGRTLEALNPEAPTMDTAMVQAVKKQTAARQFYSATANEQTALNLSQIRFNYNWIPAKTATALAFDGYTIHDPFVQQVSVLALNDKGNPFWKKNPEIAQQIASMKDPTIGAAMVAANPRVFKQDQAGKVSMHPIQTDHPIFHGVGGPVTASATIGSDEAGGLLDLLGPVGEGIKSASRWADATMSAPLEYGTGAFRDAVGGVAGAAQGGINPNAGLSNAAGSTGGTFVDPAAQTRLGIALGKTLNGGDPQLGKGFFAQGQTAEDQAANARKAFTVDGHALTVGRGLASLVGDGLSGFGVNVIQPGSIGYDALSGLTDFNVANNLDPSNLALEGLSNAHRAAQTFSAVKVAKNVEHGLIPGIRRTFSSIHAEQFLNSRPGTKLLDWAVKSQDLNEIRKVVKDVPTAIKLKDATTTEEAKSALMDVLGTTVRDRVYAPPTASWTSAVTHPFKSIGYEFHHIADPARFSHIMPKGFLDVNDPNQAVENIDRYLHNASTTFHPIDDMVKYGVDAKGNDVFMPATEAMARASVEGGRTAMLQVAEQVGKKIGDELARRGKDPALSEMMTTFFRRWEQNRAWAVDEFGNHWDPGFAKLSGRADMGDAASVIATPIAAIDMLNNVIPLPSVKDIKRDTSWVGKIPGFKNGTPQTVADAIQNNFYKPLSMLRIATTLRVLGEEQAAIAADGYISFLNHPIKAFALVAGAPVTGDRILPEWMDHIFKGRAEKEFGLTNNRGVLTGSRRNPSFAYEAQKAAERGDIPNEFAQAVTGGGYAHLLNVMEPGRKYSNFEVIERHTKWNADLGRNELDPHYIDSWAGQLYRYSTDPVFRYLGKHTEDETKAWLKDPEGGKQYADYLRGAGTTVPKDTPFRPDGFDFRDPGSVDHYVDSIGEYMNHLTGGSDNLMAAFEHPNKIVDGNGQLVDMFRLTDSRHPQQLTEEARHYLTALADPADGGEAIGPRYVVGRKLVAAEKAGASQEMAAKYDDAIRHLFSTLYERPTNRLSRSPYFRQRFWERIGELMPYTDKKTANGWLAEARRQGMFSAEDSKYAAATGALGHAMHGEPATPLTIESFERQAALAGSHPTPLTEREMENLAKGHALDHTKHLLYDLTEKGQFLDSLRLLFPFGRAWKEVTQRWFRLGAENPRVIRKFDQAITEGKRSGFFHPDPNTGEEVFSYPMSQGFNKVATGVMNDIPGLGGGVPGGIDNVPTTASLNALNLAGNGLPGVGWGGQLLMQHVLGSMPTVNDGPIGDIYRKYVAPYGDVSGGDPLHTAVNAAFPAYLDRLNEFLGSSDTKVSHANTIAEVERNLMSSGKFNKPGVGYSDADMIRLRKQATGTASQLTLLRAIGSFALPASPRFDWEVVDKGGKLALASVLSDELRKLQGQEDKGQIQSATNEFINRHGLNAFGALAPLSASMSYGLPVTEKGAKWVRAHRGAQEKYGDVYGMFAPPDPNGQFDSRFYQEQVDKGERFSYTSGDQTRTWLKMANDRMAYAQYSAMADKVKKLLATDQFHGQDRTDLLSTLAQYHRGLVKDYPGFGDDFSVPGKIPPERAVEQFRKAANDPSLRGTDAAKAGRAYLKVRDSMGKLYAAQYATNGNETGWVTSQNPDWIQNRLDLHEIQKVLVKKYPGSSAIFTNLFRKDGEA